MKKILSIILSLCMLFSVTAFASGLQEETETIDVTEYVNNEIFVMYKDGSIDVLKYNNSEELKAGIVKLSDDANVMLYQPNYSYESSVLTVNDAYLQKQWALYNDGSFLMEEGKNEFPVYDTPFGEVRLPFQWKAPENFGKPGGRYRQYSYGGNTSTAIAKSGVDINIEEAWKNYSNFTKWVVVAVVDTGVDYNHEDLSGKIWTNSREIANNGIDDDRNGYVDDFYGWNFYNNSNRVYVGSEDDHGTHGAGTIVAKTNNGTGIAGIAPGENIKVMSVKALGGKDGSGTTASVVRAIQYAEKNGASICNLSLGTSNNDKALYQTIANSNMLFVVAAGNEGQDTDNIPFYPGSYDLENMITVGNLSYNGSLNYSSNYGMNKVDIAAPGTDILSTTSGNGYSYMTGTSMAAPFVSGVAALVYSHYDGITLADVKEILYESATQTENLYGVVSAQGMLDAGRALTYDLNNLSRTKWKQNAPANYSGNVPEISAQIRSRGTVSDLTVQFYDRDNDLLLARYMEGEHNAWEFYGGKSGNVVLLPPSGIVTYEAEPGTYTFYALDFKGNETVKTVVVPENSKGGGRVIGGEGFEILDFLEIVFKEFFNR